MEKVLEYSVSLPDDRMWEKNVWSETNI